MAKERKNRLAGTIKSSMTKKEPVEAPKLIKKVPVKKTEIIEEEVIEKATKKIHQKKAQTKSVRFTMDLPEDVYYDIKMRMIKRKIKTMKEYFMILIDQDK